MYYSVTFNDFTSVEDLNIERIFQSFWWQNHICYPSSGEDGDIFAYQMSLAPTLFN